MFLFIQYILQSIISDAKWTASEITKDRLHTEAQNCKQVVTCKLIRQHSITLVTIMLHKNIQTLKC